MEIMLKGENAIIRKIQTFFVSGETKSFNGNALFLVGWQKSKVPVDEIRGANPRITGSAGWAR